MLREIVSQLTAIRDQLDAADEYVSAAHLQMAIGRLAHAPSRLGPIVLCG